MTDLSTIYPDAPGFKVPGASEEAARAIAPFARTLKERCLNVVRRSPVSLTADQIAAGLGESILSVRPRIAELRRLGLIEAADRAGKNASGMSATRWRPAVEANWGAA